MTYIHRDIPTQDLTTREALASNYKKKLFFGIDPNWTLGSIPMSNWDQSQKDFFVTAGTDLLLNNFDETEVSLFLNGLS